VRFIFIFLIFGISGVCFSQEALVSVVLHPAGSFKVRSTKVEGSAKALADGSFQAANISVGLTEVDTGIGLRDTHTKKHLETDKFPSAILVSATGKGGKGTGVIKIKGIEQKISGTYEIDGGTLTAHFPLTLSDFKIDKIKYMGIGVDDTVNVDVKVPVSK